MEPEVCIVFSNESSETRTQQLDEGKYECITPIQTSKLFIGNQYKSNCLYTAHKVPLGNG